MKKPIGFDKLYNYSNTKQDALFRVSSAIDDGESITRIWGTISDPSIRSHWILLFILNWNKKCLHTRICSRGSGMIGVWHDTFVPYTTAQVGSLSSFYDLLQLYGDKAIHSIGKRIIPNTQDLTTTDIVNGNIPLVVSENRTYLVESDSTPGNHYQVVLNTDAIFVCSCKAYTYSKVTPAICKHIKAISKMNKTPYHV
jgi:hypothetical protein